LHFRCGTECGSLTYLQKTHIEELGATCTVSNHYHARQAAAALLKMAMTTSDPNVAAGLVEAAADLKEQAGELPVAVSEAPPALLDEG
jgi:hypothetical protein